MRATRTARATRTGRSTSRRTSRRAKRSSAKRHAVKHAGKPVRVAGRAVKKEVVAPLEPQLYKLCKPGWAVIVDRAPNAQGLRFVCPFWPRSHPGPGPVRGVKKLGHSQ